MNAGDQLVMLQFGYRLPSDKVLKRDQTVPLFLDAELNRGLETPWLVQSGEWGVIVRVNVAVADGEDVEDVHGEWEGKADKFVMDEKKRDVVVG